MDKVLFYYYYLFLSILKLSYEPQYYCRSFVQMLTFDDVLSGASWFMMRGTGIPGTPPLPAHVKVVSWVIFWVWVQTNLITTAFLETPILGSELTCRTPPLLFLSVVVSKQVILTFKEDTTVF